MRRYFAEVVAMIEGSDLFEVLAHLDYPRRYWPEAAGRYPEAAFEEEYRAVLRALAASGRVLELNTASPLLSVSLLRWWREEGGTALSFGSDAHLPGTSASGSAGVRGRRRGRVPARARPVRFLARLRPGQALARRQVGDDARHLAGPQRQGGVADRQLDPLGPRVRRAG